MSYPSLAEMKRFLVLLLVLSMIAAFFTGRDRALQLSRISSAHGDRQVYVWQRVWTQEHAEALSQSHSLFSALRILALQEHPKEGGRTIAVDTALLKQDGRPVWLVARLDGQLRNLDGPALRLRIVNQARQWQTRGLNVVGVEIDHDAATARLPAYQHFLTQLRQQLSPTLKLSTTALPAWLSSASLPAVLQQIDSSVLQVHAVLSPDKGLFDTALAMNWIERYSQLTPHPFRVALPAYGMGLVGHDNQGPKLESESSLRVAGATQELTVAPQTIADFLHRLAQRRIAHLQGIIWFRLPLASDRRAWSLSTLRAVLLRQSLNAHWQVEILPRPTGSDRQNLLYDLVLRNDGQIDAPLPRRISVPASDCLAADAVGNYHLESDNQQQRFILTTGDQVRAGQDRPLGWMRCAHLQQGGALVIP